MLKNKMAKAAPKEMNMEDYKYDDHAVNSAFDTLMRAEEHKQDPKMMDLVHKKAKKHKKSIRSIAELRQVAKDMNDDGDGDE
jgi:hypothetical protein